MEKSDKSLYNICIAAIKRSTIQPYDFKWTRFYEGNADFKNIYPALDIEFLDNELVICSTIIDKDNFSILTTQKLITKETGTISIGNLYGAKGKLYGNFKGFKNELFTFGAIQLKDGNDLKYFIETGRASIVMIYGVRTRIQISSKT